jgi:hypothetical protein
VVVKHTTNLNLFSSNPTPLPSLAEKICARNVTPKDTDKSGNGMVTGLTNKTQVCHTCNTKLPLSSFSLNHSLKLGHEYICKTCKRTLDNTHYNPQRMSFLGIQIRNKTPRINICTACGKTYSENGRQMSRHHWAYIPNSPMSCVVEFCNSCHGKVPRENHKC